VAHSTVMLGCQQKFMDNAHSGCGLHFGVESPRRSWIISFGSYSPRLLYSPTAAVLKDSSINILPAFQRYSPLNSFSRFAMTQQSFRFITTVIIVVLSALNSSVQGAPVSVTPTPEYLVPDSGTCYVGHRFQKQKSLSNLNHPLGVTGCLGCWTR
jgi:hypothetical protein